MTTATQTSPMAVAAPLEPLWEGHAPSGTRVRGAGMPTALRSRHGGDLLVELRDDRPTLIANFVTTLDGIVALGSGNLTGGGHISGFHEPDRFVMALLRAVADVVLVGAGTVRGSSNQNWIAEHVQPSSAGDFVEWRDAMGLARHPTTVVVTARGDVPAGHPGLNDPSIPVVIATTPGGADRLGSAALPAHVAVRPMGHGAKIGGDDLVGLLADLGARLVLSEGGPHLLGQLVRADLLDELFLTLSPQLVGRDGPGRLGLVEGLGLGPEAGRWQRLQSVRRSGDHLFLRYRRSASDHEHEEAHHA